MPVSDKHTFPVGPRCSYAIDPCVNLMALTTDCHYLSEPTLICIYNQVSKFPSHNPEYFKCCFLYLSFSCRKRVSTHPAGLLRHRDFLSFEVAIQSGISRISLMRSEYLTIAFDYHMYSNLNHRLVRDRLTNEKP